MASALRPGFYLVQSDHCGDHRAVPRPAATMSLIEFLRRVRTRGEIPREVCVVGLDRYLARTADPRTAADIVLDVLTQGQRTRHLARPARLIVLSVGCLELSTDWQFGAEREAGMFHATWIFPQADLEVVNDYEACFSPL